METSDMFELGYLFITLFLKKKFGVFRSCGKVDQQTRKSPRRIFFLNEIQKTEWSP